MDTGQKKEIMKMKKLISIFLVVINVLLFISCSSSGPKLDVEDELNKMKTDNNIYYSENEDYSSIVKWLKYEFEENDIRGTVIVATDDEVLFAAGARLLDVDGNEVTPFTTYEIGSCSKAFVGVCIMKLVEDGKLKLTDTLGDIYPAFSSYPNFEKVSKITVSDLLHMRTGLIDYVNHPDQFLGEERVYEIFGPDPAATPWAEAYSQMEKIIDDELFLELIFTNEMTIEPNVEYSYNNSNYHLLSLIVENVSGKSYEEYINEVIFEPCKMTSTSAVSGEPVTASFKYDPELDYLKDPEFLMGAGDIHTNAVDLIKFDRALFGGYLLNEESMKEIYNFIDGYSCGWENEMGYISHRGAIPRFQTSNSILEKDGKKLYVITFSNLGEDKSSLIIQNVDRMFS